MVNCVNGKVAGLDSNSSAQLDRVQSKVQDNFRNFLTDFFFPNQLQSAWPSIFSSS